MVTNASMFEKASKPHSLMLLIALVGLSAALSQKLLHAITSVQAAVLLRIG